MVDSSSVRARAASPALKMVLGRADSARRLVPAEPDGQFDQFGRGRGGAASARDVGGGVERFERFGVCARRRQSHVPGLQLGQDHGFGQEPVRSPALGGTGICVDAARQQRMREPHRVAVNREDALGLCLRKQLCSSLGRGAGDLREQFHGRSRDGCRNQEEVLDAGIEPADAHAHQLGKCSGQSRVGVGGSHVDGTRQFERIEGFPPEISAIRTMVGRANVRPSRAETSA
jgi:hypothetical protein